MANGTQLKRSRELKSPDRLNDEISKAIIETIASSFINLEDFFDAVISRIRLNAGVEDWLKNPPDGADNVSLFNFITTFANHRTGIKLIKVSDGIFKPPNDEKFIHDENKSIIVNVNMVELNLNYHYIVSENILNEGYDRINFIGLRPEEGEVFATYYKKG